MNETLNLQSYGIMHNLAWNDVRESYSNEYSPVLTNGWLFT